MKELDFLQDNIIEHYCATPTQAAAAVKMQIVLRDPNNFLTNLLGMHELQLGVVYTRGENGAYSLFGKTPWQSNEEADFLLELAKDATVIVDRAMFTRLIRGMFKHYFLGHNIIVVTSQPNYLDKDLIVGVDTVKNFEQACRKARRKKRMTWVYAGPELTQRALGIADYAVVNTVAYQDYYDVMAPDVPETIFTLTDRLLYNHLPVPPVRHDFYIR